jgi:RNA polymerase sigma-70 factor (ECF subfamily)
MRWKMELIFRAMKGDHEAFESLVKMYRDEVFGIALNIVEDPTEADDLTQEIFIKAYLNINKLKQPERFSAWLRSIARNHCKDWLRTQKQRYLPFDDLFDNEQLELPYVSQFHLDDNFDLRLLRDEDGKLLRLFYVQGFSYEEIMRVNGISYSAVTSRMHKAREKLRSLLNKNGISTESLLSALSGGVEYMKLNLGLPSEFLNGIETVEYAQSSEEDGKRYSLWGINLEYTKECGLRLIATDGKRMAVAQLPHRNGNGDISIIIPTEELSILKEYLAGKDAEVSIEQIDENMAAFYIGDTKKLIKLIPEEYVNYKAVIFYPIGYNESITLDRKEAIRIMEMIVEASEGNYPSDWIKWEDTICITKNEMIMTRELLEKSLTVLRQILGFIVKNESPKDVTDGIFSYISRDECQNLFNEIEKGKLPPVEIVGQLKILESKGDTKFCGRFNSHFILDSLKAMEGDNITISYTLEGHFATLHPVLLKDDTENIHIIMPMKVN